MLVKQAIFIVFLFPLFLGGAFLGGAVQAEAKTVYVKEDGDNSNDGSSSNPFKTLEKAAEAVNDGDADEVKIGKGSFSGNVIFEEKVDIRGESKGSTTITGALTFKKKTSIKDLSIKTKSLNAITLGKNSHAEIENVDIRDFSGVGILLTAGSAELVLEDSRIGGSSGKGIYAEAGSKLILTGNTIVNNKQEGVDIRQNTRGTIKNNVIENNKESGIELIVGSSDFVISGNKIKDNNASGIAFQFYESYKKFGTITANGNTISGHRKYGVDCNKPQRGNTPAGYWADSITAEENAFASNGGGDISATCKLIEAKTEEEEKMLEAQVIQEEKAEEEALTTPVAPEILPEERSHQEHQAAEELVRNITQIMKEEDYIRWFSALEQRKSYQRLLFWKKNEELETLRIEIEADRQEIQEEKEKLESISAYANRADLQGQVNLEEQRLDEYERRWNEFQDKEKITNRVPESTVRKITTWLYVVLF